MKANYHEAAWKILTVKIEIKARGVNASVVGWKVFVLPTSRPKKLDDPGEYAKHHLLNCLCPSANPALISLSVPRAQERRYLRKKEEGMKEIIFHAACIA